MLITFYTCIYIKFLINYLDKCFSATALCLKSHTAPECLFTCAPPLCISRPQTEKPKKNGAEIQGLFLKNKI